MKLSTSLGVIVGGAVLGMSVLGGYALVSLRETMLAERKAAVAQVTHLAANQVKHYQGLEQAGKLSREEAQAAAKEAVRALREGDNFVFVRAGEGLRLSVVHPDPRKEGQESDGGKAADGRTVVDAYAQELRKADFAFIYVFTKRPKGEVDVPKINGVQLVSGWNWVVGTGAFVDDIDATFQAYVVRFLFIGGILLLVVGALAVALARRIYHSIGGEPQLAAEVARAIADGDLTHAVGRQQHQGSMLAAVADMQESLKKMIGHIRQGAETLQGASDGLTAQMGQINQAAQRSSEATAATAAAIQEMTQSVAQISDNAAASSQNSRRASELAGEGGKLVDRVAAELHQVAGQVSDASGRIEGLVERSREIDGIANVIKEIADQTNLLALNAAIEAARAGEQGRGFAVVADEVRKLAERSSKATDQIAGVIRAIQTDTSAVVASMQAVKPQVEQGVAVATEAGQALGEINEGAGKTLSNIQEVAHSTEEQRQASDNVAANVERIAEMVDEMAHSVADAHGNVQALERLALDLRDSVTRFRV